MTKTKKCGTCHRRPVQPSAAGIRRNQCRACFNAYMREYMREYRRRMREAKGSGTTA